jgi:hypothetical protein
MVWYISCKLLQPNTLHSEELDEQIKSGGNAALVV